MSDKLKKWINDHAEFINNEQPVNLLVGMFESLPWLDFMDACKMFLIAGIVNKDAIMDAFCIKIAQTTQEYKDDSYSTAEARLGWCVDCVGLFPTLTYDEVVKYLLKNHKKYGIEMKPIDQQYWWQPDHPDYDLGWFNPTNYNKWS